MWITEAEKLVQEAWDNYKSEAPYLKYKMCSIESVENCPDPDDNTEFVEIYKLSLLNCNFKITTTLNEKFLNTYFDEYFKEVIDERTGKTLPYNCTTQYHKILLAKFEKEKQFKKPFKEYKKNGKF